MKTIISFLFAYICIFQISFAQSKCEIQPSNCTDEHITFFTINGAASASTCSQIGYNNRPGVFTELVKGYRYDFQSNTSSSQTHLAIWIDYNGNGDFSDRDEMVFSSRNMANTFSGVISVPRFLPVENYRLRVKVSRNIQMFNADACINFDEGEVEDYTISIVDLNVSKPQLLTDNIICSESRITAFARTLNNGLGVLPTANTFLIQMADKVNNFTIWNTVATLNRTTIDTFSFFIPHTFSPDIYKVRVVSSFSETIALVSEEIKIRANFAPPIVTTSNLNVCTPSNRLLSFSSAGSAYSWYLSSDTLNPIQHKTASLNVININKDTTFYVAVRNLASGCESRKTKATFRYVNTLATDFNPKTGVRGFTQLTITGARLHLVTHLTVGTINTINFTVNKSHDTIKVIIPANAASGNIIVHTPCVSTQLSHLTINIARVEPPTISPDGGVFDGEANVTMVSATPGAAIYYTTNGNNPVVGASFTRLYTGSFVLWQSATLRAIAAIPGMTNSTIAARPFTINNPSFVEPVTMTPAPGTYQSAKTITLGTITAAAKIYYTLNGTVPLIGAAATMEYLHPFTVSDARTNVRAIAVKNEVLSSHTSAVYIINRSDTVGRPRIIDTFDPITLTNPDNSVVLHTGTPDAEIYYTINGSRVNIGAEHTFRYNEPIVFSGSFMLTARAFKNDMVPSTNLRRYFSYSSFTSFRFAAEMDAELKSLLPEILVYPNPAQKELHIENIDLKSAQIRLITAGGKVFDVQSSMHALFDNRCTLKLNNQPRGLYILQISTPLGDVERKIVLN